MGRTGKKYGQYRSKIWAERIKNKGSTGLKLWAERVKNLGSTDKKYGQKG
jgi:hypothetical protein